MDRHKYFRTRRWGGLGDECAEAGLPGFALVPPCARIEQEAEPARSVSDDVTGRSRRAHARAPTAASTSRTFRSGPRQALWTPRWSGGRGGVSPLYGGRRGTALRLPCWAKRLRQLALGAAFPSSRPSQGCVKGRAVAPIPEQHAAAPLSEPQGTGAPSSPVPSAAGLSRGPGRRLRRREGSGPTLAPSPSCNLPGLGAHDTYADRRQDTAQPL